jgi:hypothetical protein
MTGSVPDKHKPIKPLLYDSIGNNAYNARPENGVNFLDCWKPDYKRRDKKLTSLPVQELFFSTVVPYILILSKFFTNWCTREML